MQLAILLFTVGLSATVASPATRIYHPPPSPDTQPALVQINDTSIVRHIRVASSIRRKPDNPASAIHANSNIPDETNSYFTVVGSFETAKGAMKHVRNIRRADISANVAVYPPYYRTKSYWTVVAAAYSTKNEAERHVDFARHAWRIQDAFVRRLPEQGSMHPRPYNVYVPSVALAVYPNFIAAPATANSPDASQFVFIGENTNKEDANNRADEIRHNFSGLNIAVFPPRIDGDPWRIALAAHTAADQAQKARQLAMQLNLAEKPAELSFKPGDVLMWRPSDRTLAAAANKFRRRVESCFRDGSVTMGEMRSCAGTWVTPQALVTCIGDSNALDKVPTLADSEACAAIPDTPEGAILIANRGLTPSTRLTLEASNYYKVTEPDLKGCVAEASGDLTKLQRCMVPKLFTKDQQAAMACMQKGSGNDVEACLRKAAVTLSGPQGQRAEATLKCMASEDGTLAGIAKCLPVDDRQALERMQRFQQCTATAGSEKDFISNCLPGITLVEDSTAKCLVDAGGNAEKLKDCAIRDVPGAKDMMRLSTCTGKAGKDPLALSKCLSEDTGNLSAAIAACLTTAGSSTAHIQECLTKTDSRFEAAEKLRACVDTSKNDPIALVRTCGDSLMANDSQNLAVCLLTKGGDPNSAVTGCGALPANANEVVEAIACIQSGGSDSNRLVECIVQNRPNYLAAVQTTQCVSSAKGDASKLAACAAARIGGTVGAVTQCMVSQPSDSRDPLKCVSAANPRLAEAQKAYTCIQQAGEVGGALEACTYGIVDRKTQQALTCVSRANGDRTALAACAGQAVLPGEAGRLAGCAASSQGAASFGVCAISPNINEEWRIAADCAVSCGGEPISFATCTGGRLTMRELTKCLGGEIGKDCFGPNNTIRKYYESMFNDLTKGPGPNNEAVKVVRAIGDGVNEVAKGVEHVGQEIGKEVDRRAREAKDTLEKPVEKPVRTAVCVASFGAFCKL